MRIGHSLLSSEREFDYRHGKNMSENRERQNQNHIQQVRHGDVQCPAE